MTHFSSPAILRDPISAREVRWKKLDRRIFCRTCNAKIGAFQWSAAIDRLTGGYGRYCPSCANGLVGTRGEVAP